MSKAKPVIVAVGELLWDLLPGGKQLGGAPSNFVYMATQLGNQGYLASRVGADALGQEALQQLQQADMELTHIQTDPHHPTGTVAVELDKGGQPRYTINEAVAWDFFEWTPQWQSLAEQADAVCFGTLAQRTITSQQTIRRFVQSTRPDAVRLLDVNLREPFYGAQLIAESLELANVVKLNDGELVLIGEMFGFDYGSQEANLHHLLERYKLRLICLTRGAQGSLLVSPDESVFQASTPVKVVDTIGAGDSFTAALLHHYLRGSGLNQMGAAANRLGGWVATQTGGMPHLDPATLAQIV